MITWQENLTPLLRSKEGDPFVFWSESLLILYIRHGRWITIIAYDNGGDQEDHTIQDFNIRDCRGRIIASFNSEAKTICIKRDGISHKFRMPGRIVSTQTVDGHFQKDLQRLIDECL